MFLSRKFEERATVRARRLDSLLLLDLSHNRLRSLTALEGGGGGGGGDLCAALPSLQILRLHANRFASFGSLSGLSEPPYSLFPRPSALAPPPSCDGRLWLSEALKVDRVCSVGALVSPRHL
jgi:hypothetical protein